MSSRAVVVLSGGQDSATCLRWAQVHYEQVYAITFRYGQRHSTELDAARIICAKTGVQQRVVPVELFGGALVRREESVDSVRVDGLPSTFTPGRNLVFLTMAAAYAASLVPDNDEMPDLVTGVCQTDYSGYPDCRERTMESLAYALSLGMAREVRIVTPLMYLTKADTVRLMVQMGGYDLLAHTVTCYCGETPGCGKCPSCVLRIRGFVDAGVRDPLYSEEKWKEVCSSWRSEELPESGPNSRAQCPEE